MFSISLKRFISAVPTIFFITILVFLCIRLLPGNPVDLLIGERGAKPEFRKEFEQKLGLDKPIYIQYLVFLKLAVQGDLGTSIKTGGKVLTEFLEHFPATVELSLSALFLAVLLGIPLGVLSALFRNSWWDRCIVSFSLTGYSMSVFWWGLVLILVFSIQMEWTPVSGRIDVLYDVPSVTGFMLMDTLLAGSWPAFWSFLSHLILPAFTLASVPFTFIVRMTRSSFIETLQEDFIRTAKAKGLSFCSILIKHAFRNALLPIITMIGLMLGILITGTVLTETVFSWPGIGSWLVHAVEARDYPVLQGGILLIAVIVVLVNLLVDLTYMLIDPRLKKGIG